METIGWAFNTLRPCDKLRNPIQGEFFATSATGGPAHALVRESIQNSLDAHAGTPPVRVLIRVDKTPGSSQHEVDELFDGAWEHFGAEGNGLHDPKPKRGDSCPHLVVEDFNTRGLTGDPVAVDVLPGARNNFYSFFRAEGVSGKTGSDLGRWGVGKFVFPRSSRVSAHFAITVRDDDHRRLMLGAVTLKGHRIAGQGGLFTPDALYGQRRDGGFVLPIEDKERVDRVASLFGLERSGEAGTSVIVPYIDPEEFTREKLVDAIVRSYFVPILKGDLEVTVRHHEHKTVLSKSTLVAELESLPNLAPELLPLIHLAQHAATVADEERLMLKMPDPAGAAKWCDELASPEVLEQLRHRLSRREAVSVRVPVTVRNKSCGGAESYFDIHLQPEPDGGERPVFVRQGIIVSGVRDRRIHEMRSLVIVDDAPLAEALGNSENPAHTEWQKDGSNFKGRYVYGPGLIDFVVHGVSKLLQLVNRASEEPDPSLTIDFFSIDAQGDSGEPARPRETKPKPGSGSEQSQLNVGPRPSRLVIRHSTAGFAVVAGDEPPPVPFMLEIRCAYETGTGNALKKWNVADFTFGLNGLPVALFGGVEQFSALDNRLLFHVSDHDFRVVVDGFDTNRDLYVRADVRKSAHADPQD